MISFVKKHGQLTRAIHIENTAGTFVFFYDTLNERELGSVHLLELGYELMLFAGEFSHDLFYI